MATLRQYEYLVTVVETGSFTRAAELLHVSQPALSHQVRALERECGGPLLERLPRSVRLTPMGREVEPHARAALAGAERARAAARRAAGLDGGELQLAVVYSVALGVLPPVLRAWRARHPQVRVRLREYPHTEALTAAMADGGADLAVGPRPDGWAGPVRELGQEEFVVVLAEDDPGGALDGAPGEAPDGRIALASLADREWVHYAPGNGLVEVLDAACAAAGFRPRAGVRTEQTAAAPLLAAAGLGPALVPGNLLPPGFAARVLHPDPPVRRTLAGYARPEPDRITAAFLEVLAAHARVGEPGGQGAGGVG
ncbi:LysR substrate-binding domain-containing protein [Kitasatospora sp. NPDC051853]|uniref:LysR substrate-binding domain-containing protein n=1 Tax=Kitasatospora sp. NPDC051853 TaxID=3364058 RepID=UPI00379305E0